MPNKKSKEEELREELHDLRAGIPSHQHQPRDGSGAFRCTSPYCEDLGSAEPATSPSGREDSTMYRRGGAIADA